MSVIAEISLPSMIKCIRDEGARQKSPPQYDYTHQGWGYPPKVPSPVWLYASGMRVPTKNFQFCTLADHSEVLGTFTVAPDGHKNIGSYCLPAIPGEFIGAVTIYRSAGTQGIRVIFLTIII